MYENNNSIILLKKNPGESNEFMFLKYRFLEKCDLSKKKDYYLSLANIYANHKLKNCQYNSSVMNLINSIIS